MSVHIQALSVFKVSKHFDVVICLQLIGWQQVSHGIHSTAESSYSDDFQLMLL